MSGDATRSVHAGEARVKPYGALTTPIVQTSTYTFADSAELRCFMEAKAERGAARERSANLALRGEYGRYGNPTQEAVEAKLADLEGGERAVLFGSGMAAISTTLLTILAPGDHVVVLRDIYRRTREFASTFLKRWGVAATLLPADSFAELDRVLQPNTRLILVETPSNPHLRVLDLQVLSRTARRCGVLTLVDSTFATPINLRPLECGADLVVHSASKYLGGHNDLLAGAVIGTHQLLNAVEEARGLLGAISGPQECYLLLRGLKTLALRVERQNATSLRVARALEAHPAVARVYYPALESHPDHAIAMRLMRGHGGVVSFEVRGDLEAASRVVDRLRIPYIGPTLGGVESIVQQPALFVSLAAEERQSSGLSDTLIRYAVGLEDAEDLIADLQQALSGIL